MVYREDVRLSVAFGLVTQEALDLDPIWDKWQNRSPVPPSYVDVFWSGGLADRFVYGAVDGGRAYLPWPDNPQTLAVYEPHATLVQLIDSVMGRREFERYWNEAGLNKVGDLTVP